jgi:hypothetical protein
MIIKLKIMITEDTSENNGTKVRKNNGKRNLQAESAAVDLDLEFQKPVIHIV